MTTPTKSHRFINKLNMRYPMGTLESKALYLEETLEKMQNKLLYFEEVNKEKNGKDKRVKYKIYDLKKGILEVHQKCLVIWDEISKERN